MPHCAVFGCRNNTKYKDRDPSIRFHSFPSDSHLREKWIKFCCRPADFNVKAAAVCSSHFTDDQKQKSMMNRLLGVSPVNARNLIPDAVPNINHPEDYLRQKQLKKNRRKSPKKSVCAEEIHETNNEVMGASEPLTLFDFTTGTDVNDWIEISDTKRDVGMSKASFVLQKTQKFQRAVFFTMLNPQPNGAGFAGVSCRSLFNLQDYSSIEMLARAQGSVSDYKVVLRHKGLNTEPNPTYEQFFTMPLNEFANVSLPLSGFEPYYRGRKLNSTEAEPLDKSQISSFGFQVYGGVYHPKKQSGISAFEVDWVKAI